MADVNFQPKFIMGNVVELYINFSKNEDFLRQITKDERCFSIQLFERTAQKLNDKNVISPDKLEEFALMMKKLEKMLQEKQQYDEALEGGAIPDEYLDPILGEIMKDPVLLPNSKVKNAFS